MISILSDNREVLDAITVVAKHLNPEVEVVLKEVWSEQEAREVTKQYVESENAKQQTDGSVQKRNVDNTGVGAKKKRATRVPKRTPTDS